MKKYHKHLTKIITLSLALSSTVHPLAVMALTANFTQKILPLDCVFTVVNAGTGELYYVTPQTCGVLSPPSLKPVSGSSNISSTQAGVELVPFNFRLSTGKSQAKGLAVKNLPPWEPIATVSASESTALSGNTGSSGRSSTPKVALTLAIGGSIAFVVALLFFLF